ncbi:hypothetical protein ACFY30_31640 [Streptomyces sp. NPDC000345]|uniref:hypothetical protein n=1 Tax=Streptomyces sp. NPDC000345 TaxID=3364537 RepID=UPI0036C397E5
MIEVVGAVAVHVVAVRAVVDGDLRAADQRCDLVVAGPLGGLEGGDRVVDVPPEFVVAVDLVLILAPVVVPRQRLHERRRVRLECRQPLHQRLDLGAVVRQRRRDLLQVVGEAVRLRLHRQGGGEQFGRVRCAVDGGEVLERGVDVRAGRPELGRVRGQQHHVRVQGGQVAE